MIGVRVLQTWAAKSPCRPSNLHAHVYILGVHALLALCMLHGSYQYVEAGHVKDALVDMSGGMSETFSFQRQDTLPPNLWEVLIKSFDMGGLLGCTIKVMRRSLKF